MFSLLEMNARFACYYIFRSRVSKPVCSLGIADLLCFCGDCPAVAEAIGFKESASANLPCRQCLTHRNNLFAFDSQDLDLRPRSLVEIKKVFAHVRGDPTGPDRLGVNRLSALAQLDGMILLYNMANMHVRAWRHVSLV